jgi:cellobiose transport system permease protein
MTANVGARHGAQHAGDPSPPRRRASGDEGWRNRLNRIDTKSSPYLYIAPFFVLFLAFGLFPVLYTVYVSTQKWSLIGGRKGFIGLDNYRELVQDEKFWNAMYVTFGLFVVATVPQLLLALLLANWLNRRMRFRTAFRLGILLPNITSVAAVGIVFGFIFADRYGLANWVLDLFGAGPIDWRQHRWSSWLAIGFMVDWRWIGYNSLIYLAAMQAIPRDLYESAAIDGASPTRQFWRITVPLIQPTILFTVIISTIGGMQLFTEPLLFNYGNLNGGSLGEFQTIALYIYQRTFSLNFEYGYGAAMSWALFLIIIIFALINFALVRRSVKGSTL